MTFLLLLPLVQDPFTVDKVIATVNDQVLTLAQVDRKAKEWALLLAPDQRDAATKARLNQEALEDSLTIMLLSEGFFALARQRGFEGVLDSRIAAERARKEEAAGSVGAFAQKLAANGRTIQEWETLKIRELAALSYQQMALGMSPILGTKIFLNDCNPKPREVRAWYENNLDKYQVEARVKARMILLKDEQGKEDASLRIRAMAAAFEKGKLNFAETAREHSAYRASIGGSMGKINPATYKGVPGNLRSFLSSASPGQLSEPFEMDDFGGGSRWGLILVEEVQPAGVKSLKEVHASIEDRLTKEAQTRAFQETLLHLRKECTVWTNPGTPFAMAALNGLVARSGPADEGEL